MTIHISEQVLLASMKARMPAVLVGPPGVGKTAKIQELANRMGYELVTLIGSQLDPTDIVGLPKGELIGTDDSGEKIYGTVNLAPWWQVKIITKKKIILFLDEMSNTSSSTRASMLTMLQSREFPNGVKMPPETIVVGAMNPAEEAADGYELDYPTTNRINFIVWSPSRIDWEDGMLVNWGNSMTDSEKTWREKVVGFIRDNPSMLQKLPTGAGLASPEAVNVNPNDVSAMEVLRYAWPSRRSWDNLSRTLPHAKGQQATEDTLAQGIVGYEAAIGFRDWLNRHSTISPSDLLKNPDKFNWKKSSPAESTQLLRDILNIVNDDQDTKNLLRVFETIAEQNVHAIAAPYVGDATKMAVQKASPEVRKENQARALKLLKAYREISKEMRG